MSLPRTTWKTQWICGVYNSRPEYCKELLSHRTVAGFSDGGAHAKFQTMGIYPTDLLSWLVRDTGTITLEQAHYHLSYMPAWVAGFKDRGCIREGLAADLIVYDLDKLGSRNPRLSTTCRRITIHAWCSARAATVG